MRQLSLEEGFEINDTFWSVLKFMRQYYNEHSIAPDVRHVVSILAVERQCDKKVAK